MNKISNDSQSIAKIRQQMEDANLFELEHKIDDNTINLHQTQSGVGLQ